MAITYTVDVKKISKQLQFQRLNTRVALEKAANELHDRLARQSGAFTWGRDKDGNGMPTKKLRAFGIAGPGEDGMVVVPRKKEDTLLVKKLPKEKVDAMEKPGGAGVPRRAVKTSMNIIIAVRQAEHIWDSYVKEVEITYKLLGGLDDLNVYLSKLRRPPASVIDAVLTQLIDFRGNVLSKKTSAVKRVATMGKLEKLIEKLEEVKNSTNPAFDLGSLCRIFVAFRDRFGEWRDWHIAGLKKYNRLLEYSLRAERDEWAYSKLVMMGEDSERVWKILRDAPKSDGLPTYSPRYIYEELKKSGDGYLDRFLDVLKVALAGFEKKVFSIANTRFMEAARLLDRKIHLRRKN